MRPGAPVLLCRSGCSERPGQLFVSFKRKKHATPTKALTRSPGRRETRAALGFPQTSARGGVKGANSNCWSVPETKAASAESDFTCREEGPGRGQARAAEPIVVGAARRGCLEAGRLRGAGRGAGAARRVLSASRAGAPPARVQSARTPRPLDPTPGPRGRPEPVRAPGGYMESVRAGPYD